VSGRRTVLLSLLAVGFVVAILLILTLLPLPQHFSFQGAVVGDLYSCSGPGPVPTGTIDLPKGTTVNFQWSAPSPVSSFIVVSCVQNGLIYGGSGIAGSGSFVSVGGGYVFGVPCLHGPCIAANVSGSYTAALLPIW
jgi:hypothetical protein